MDKFSVLIPSFREPERLRNLVKSVLKDKLKNKIEKIIVVTPDKKLILPESKKILLIKESKRKGKYFAIRLGLKNIKTKTVVMLSSDLRMRKNFFRFLLKHFEDSRVGMVIGRPKADKNSRIYPFSKIVWDLHHSLCLKEPKGTEICAFREIPINFPKVSADEVFLEYQTKKAGKRLVYEPRAFGYTKIPESLSAFFRQRKRSFLGHLQMKKEYNFSPSSMNFVLLSKILAKLLKGSQSKKNLLPLLVVIFIEIFARLFAFLEFFLFKKTEIIW